MGEVKVDELGTKIFVYFCITGNPAKTKKRSLLPSTSRGVRGRTQLKTSLTTNSRSTKASCECVYVLHVIMSITILCEIIC